MIFQNNHGPHLVFFFILLTVFGGCDNKPAHSGTGPVEAKDALSTFTIAEGFKIEMIASEPLVFDPVDMEIDEYGRLYVVEMPGYPLDKSRSGKIILLSDSDGDGNMDKRTVFREGLMLPSSILRWKKGVIVTDAPNLLYLEDTNGDGYAEKSDTLLRGFALTNPQHNTNSPVYGLDNWIYIAHEGSVSTREYKEEFGDEGSEIIFPGHPDAPKLPKNANGLSIRFRPDKKQIEMNSSRCQFGHTFDQWGHRFACTNSNQGFHEVIANRYFTRNSYLPVSESTQNMSDHLNSAEVFPTTTHPDRQLLTNVGVMTSACGLTSYQGAAFPPPYDQNITFIAEPVSNLVHVDILKDTGASFTASRILENREFLTSSDSWSRPVNIYVGPDGALYMLDYYRRLIESPEWMAEEVVKAGGLYDGSDKGRIYRITPANGIRADWTKGLALGDAGVQELVKTLAHPNNWWRMHAQRLLVDRNDASAIPLLEKLTIDTSSALGRVHALWTLEGMNALSTVIIMQALKDAVPGVRENAIQLAELHLSGNPSLSKALIALQNDIDPKVRFQLLLTLGFVNSKEALAARNNLLFSDINDKWVHVAALSASSSQAASLLNVVLNRFRLKDPAYALLVQRLTAMIARAGRTDEIHLLVRKATLDVKQTTWQAAILDGLAEGLRSGDSTVRISEENQDLLIRTFFTSDAADLQESSLRLLEVSGITNSTAKDKFVQNALTIAKDNSQPDKKRALAVRSISLGDPAQHVPELMKMIVPQEKTSVQLAAVNTFGKVKGPEVSEYLIRQWPVLTPEIRDAAIPAFLADSVRVAMLVDAIEKNLIKPEHISFSNSVELMENKDENLRNKARTIFTKNEKERKKVNREYEASLNITGDVSKGKQVYIANCAICHQIRGKMGVAFGPDLGTIHNWIKEDIMANVLDPNLSISSGFDMWNVELNNGEKVQGIIFTETPTALTLRNNGKADRIVNRSEVKSIMAMNMSAMPSGFERTINKDQMADLLTLLRQN